MQLFIVFSFLQTAEHVMGTVLCAPGCFSVYRINAIRDILPIYATDVEKGLEFLIKDMGEDRWLCTLLVGTVSSDRWLCTLLVGTVSSDR
jgi:cellulose synthase/poly-beta-1,6-N-acetylglucosamine synthase-like glycosyltransferase